ncbi:jg17110 [Pararge aegeria aegeria]|uniref:Jg17110 protein n=2 Tax=Pararge aegeria TaxID=116150 RepID=A0A8S4RWL8_9NEOP|nr:jg17110 [Pararge aegeria aegeria]
MALARFTIIISLLLYNQGIHGQQSGSKSDSSNGQNNYGQIVKSNQENLIQNKIGNSGNLATNLNANGEVHFQSLTPQSKISTQSTPSLQQPQSISQPLNVQFSQIPNFQNAITVQPSLQFDTSFLQQPLQSAGIQKTQNNMPQQQNVYKIPLNIQPFKQLNAQQPLNYNIQQQFPIANSVVQQTPVQSPTGAYIPNASYTSTFPSVSNCPFQRADAVNNLGVKYLPPTASAYSIKEAPQISTSYSTSPVMAVLSTPTPIPLVTHSAMPYGNQISDIIESPLRISNNFFIDDEENNLNQDRFMSALMSIIQSPKKSAIASANPYLQTYAKQGTKSSTLKSLLPLIFNLLSEKREGCGCCEGCQNCEQKKKTKKDTEPKVYGGYSKNKDYSLKDEMFQKDRSEEDIPRMVREHKNAKKLKNSIPIDSCEDESAEYGDCFEDED